MSSSEKALKLVSDLIAEQDLSTQPKKEGEEIKEEVKMEVKESDESSDEKKEDEEKKDSSKPSSPPRKLIFIRFIVVLLS